MEFIAKPPKWIQDLLPEGAKEWGWWLILGFAALILLLIVWAVLSKLRGLFSRGPETPPQENLEELLETIPPAKASTGDRQLRIEGVPVRLRLVVIAAAGKESRFDPKEVQRLLEKVLPGLGQVYAEDKPRLRVWPLQLSYEGFTKHFHRNMILPKGEEDGKLSRWVLVAGRAKLDTTQIMLGLGLQAIKPTTIPRQTVDSHEWPVVLRVRAKD